MPKLFITGISGLIGRTIAQRAVSLGYDVTGVDRTGKRIAGIKVVKADIRDTKKMLELTKKSNYVIHVAAITSNLEFSKNMALCYDVNVNGFNSVIDAAAKNNCERVVYASSSAVYSDKFSEDVVFDLQSMKNHYAKTKLMNEMVAESYNDVGDVEAVGTRYFNTYGPGEWSKGAYANIINIYIRELLEKGQMTIYGDGKQRRDIIYVGDVADITLRLLKKGKPGIYNVGTGKTTSFNEIAQMIGGKRVYVKNKLNTYQLLTKADTRKLLGAIGDYKFKSVRDGIREMKAAAGLK